MPTFRTTYSDLFNVPESSFEEDFLLRAAKSTIFRKNLGRWFLRLGWWRATTAESKLLTALGDSQSRREFEGIVMRHQSWTRQTILVHWYRRPDSFLGRCAARQTSHALGLRVSLGRVLSLGSLVWGTGQRGAQRPRTFDLSAGIDRVRLWHGPQAPVD